jgi:hypothetical protein
MCPLMQEEPTYRRGQVEWALWKFATIEYPTGEEARTALLGRIKHLLLIDRLGIPFGKTVFRRPIKRALTSGASEGTGVDAEFTAFDAFCIAIALDLLRAGFKQTEVMILMRRLRGLLEHPFQLILDTPPPFRSHLKNPGRQEKARTDCHMFLVIERVEAAERVPERGRGRYAKTPLNIEPKICTGMAELSDYLATMDHVFRRAIVFEIANIAARVSEFLAQAPIIKRGRK